MPIKKAFLNLPILKSHLKKSETIIAKKRGRENSKNKLIKKDKYIFRITLQVPNDL
jgi:hypothetical protein